MANHLSSKTPLELLKIEISIVSFLYLVLGFSITAISGHNQLLFDLANGQTPDSFVPYAPLFEKIVIFTFINIVFSIFGIIAATGDRVTWRIRSILTYLNAITFIVALGYFAYILNALSTMFYFH